jgi:hypothetical protein
VRALDRLFDTRVGPVDPGSLGRVCSNCEKVLPNSAFTSTEIAFKNAERRECNECRLREVLGDLTSAAIDAREEDNGCNIRRLACAASTAKMMLADWVSEAPVPEVLAITADLASAAAGNLPNGTQASGGADKGLPPVEAHKLAVVASHALLDRLGPDKFRSLVDDQVVTVIAASDPGRVTSSLVPSHFATAYARAVERSTKPNRVTVTSSPVDEGVHSSQSSPDEGSNGIPETTPPGAVHAGADSLPFHLEESGDLAPDDKFVRTTQGGPLLVPPSPFRPHSPIHHSHFPPRHIY